MKNAFLNCASDGLIEDVKYLLSKGADVNCSYEQGGYTALMMAVLNNHTELIQILLDAGADISMKDHAEKKTALQMSETKLVREMLLKAGNQM